MIGYAPLRRWMALASLLLAACGGGRALPDGSDGRAQAQALQPPSAAVAARAACAADAQRDAGPLVHRLVEDRCLRTFTGFDAQRQSDAPARRRAQAAAATTLTITVLFDWAERTYPTLFPSHESDRQLGVYTYRYYAQTGNHVAVAGDDVYVQGPLSGGSLLYVGKLASFTCTVLGTGCTPPEQACRAIASWKVGANTCTTNADQLVDVPSGSTVTYLDSSGDTRGSATYSCADGAMTVKGVPSCELSAPLACNTAGLTWASAGNTCVANPGEPTQIASGQSHTFVDSIETAGQASYACNNGALTLTAVPTCEPPTPIACRLSGDYRWTSAGGDNCLADYVPPEIADGASFRFTDASGEITGSDTQECLGGTLRRVGTAVCGFLPHMTDSFGGDGGAATGGSAGDGSAGDGAPIIGGLVRVVDTTGKSATATTDSQGYFRVNLTGMVPPLVFSVTRTDGVVRHSLSTQALRINGYIYVSITGLTDKIASDVARAAGFAGAASLTPAMVAANPGALQAALEALRTEPVIAAEIVRAGLNPSTFDPLYTPFRPNHTGYDAVLDNLVIFTDVTGETLIKPVDCPTPASWQVGGVVCTTDTDVPTTIRSGTTLILHDYNGPTYGTVGFSCYRSVLSTPILPSCVVD